MRSEIGILFAKIQNPTLNGSHQALGYIDNVFFNLKSGLFVKLDRRTVSFFCHVDF